MKIGKLKLGWILGSAGVILYAACYLTLVGINRYTAYKGSEEINKVTINRVNTMYNEDLEQCGKILFSGYSLKEILKLDKNFEVLDKGSNTLTEEQIKDMDLFKCSQKEVRNYIFTKK
ncbi:hypothetical protein [Paenibacillus sp. Soil750]|uniref:hypothetical protein n=1 Tax=Paenibacillus sp. Soil750 TaxID=1736398 RepID=UPI0006F27BA4|nr:hypothetical protein [Paenibacillus sp. Soil750]KRE69684.1 hypothetical protein ASL11_15050 [Paenibacillus sp. Soil750]